MSVSRSVNNNNNDKKKNNYNECGTVAKEKREKIWTFIRVNNKNNYNNRETLSMEDSYRVKPIRNFSLSNLRDPLSLSRWHLARCLCSGKLRERNCVSRVYCNLPHIPHRRNFGSVHDFVSFHSVVTDPSTIHIIALFFEILVVHLFVIISYIYSFDRIRGTIRVKYPLFSLILSTFRLAPARRIE